MWQSIDNAPQNRWIFVYCPSKDGLPFLISLCKYHESAGFCVDEIREPAMWCEIEYPLPPGVDKKA